MRKSKQDTVLTRTRIVEVASSEFRRNGIDRTGLNELMAAVGLTRGGFYRHFRRKIRLLPKRTPKLSIPNSSASWLSPADAKRTKALRAAVNMYLSNAQRDDPATSCPLAMPGSELARSSEETRNIATDGIRKLAELFGTASGAFNSKEATNTGLLLLAMLAGALTVSRILLGAQFSEAITETKKAINLVRTNSARRRWRTRSGRPGRLREG